MITLDVKQGSDTWLEERTGRITGSRCGAILGHSPFSKPDDVMREMVRLHHGEEREFTGNIATRWGNDHEAEGVASYHSFTEFPVVHPGMWVDENMEWLGYSPDGVATGNEDEDILLDVKCPFSKKIPDSPPEHYVDQLQLGMTISGIENAHLYYWTPGKCKCFSIKASKSWVKTNLPKLKKFHKKYIKELENDAHRQPKQAHRDDLDWMLAADAYRSSVQAVKLANDTLKKAKELLLSLSEIPAEGSGVSTTLVTRKGNIQYTKVPELEGVDLDQYRSKDSEYWRITVSE